MRKLFLLLIAVFLLGFAGSTFIKLEASTSVNYTVTGVFDTGGEWAGLSGSNTRGNSMSFDISSKPSGHDFAFWIVNGVVRKDLPVDHEYTFTTINELQIVFTPTGKFAAVFIDSNGQFLGVKYTEGGEVLDTGLLSAPARPGFVVVSGAGKWTSIEGSASIADVQENSVFVLTYEEDTTPIGAVTLSITDGTASVANPVPFNSLVTITADTAPEGQAFAGWEENGRIVSFSSEYKFSALYNRTIKATYAAPESIEERPIVILSNNLDLRLGYHTYAAQFELPSGYTLVEYGIIATDAFLPNLTLDTTVDPSETMIVAQGTNHQTATKEYVISISDLDVDPITTRAYLIVKNPSNVEEIYYCEEGLMIFAVYGGGGNSGSTYTHDYIVLWNGTNSAIDLNGYSVQYASATGTTWQVTDIDAKKISTTIIPARGFYVIQQAQGSGGTTSLPQIDAANTTAMSGTAGKVVLVASTTALSGANPTSELIKDFVGFGTTANGFEGSGPTPAPSNANHVIRKYYKDTNQNNSDFKAEATNFNFLNP